MPGIGEILAAALLSQTQATPPPLLPARPWYSARTRALASQYSFCRSRGVEGAMPVDSVAQGRAIVATMIYARRARCHRERSRFLSALGADARHSGAFPGEEEFLLDMFDRNIDQRLQDGFAWGDLPEQ